MNAALHHVITRPGLLTAVQREEMFALFAGCYDCVTRAAFDRDLAGKTSVILLCDGAGAIRGFSTQQLTTRPWRGESVQVLFSGDTIVDPACWGSQELVRGWCQVVARALKAEPGRRLFWFLISKGYRTWLFLPVYFRRFLPAPEGAPEEWQDLLRAEAVDRFGDCYDPAAGVIRFPESHGHLTPDLAAIPEARLADPRVRFFLERNPGYARGDELACLAEVALENMQGPGGRMLRKALESCPDKVLPEMSGLFLLRAGGPRSLRAAVANTLWRAACEPARRRLRQALDSPAAAQAAVLRRILAANQHTEFARRHGLHPDMSIPAFQAAVPLAGYAAREEEVIRMMNGEPDVLCAGRPDAFERSSGSTAAAKYLPFTAGLRAEFSEAVRAWMGDLLTRHPGVRHGPAWWIVSPLRQPGERTAGGIPVGLESDEEYLGPIERRLASWLRAVPPAIARLTDLDQCLDWTLRFLLQRPDLRMISVWNPSFLTLLWQRLRERPDDFLTQLASGRGPGKEPFLTPFLRACPRRAAELRAAPALTPEQVWPGLAVISGWADGEAAADADRVRSLFPHAVYQPKGLLATEGAVTIPWGDDAAAGVPALHSHFLEFLDGPDGPPRLVQELEPGRDYAVVLTTSGGMWRYPLGDLVRVDGREGGSPRLRFAGRADDVCDLRGEKLHPEFVRNALAGLVSGFRLLAPVREADPPHYVLFTAASGISPAAVDGALGANPHYAWARQAGQLGPVRVLRILDADPAAVYLRHCVALGQRAGTVKPAALHRASGWEGAFRIADG